MQDPATTTQQDEQAPPVALAAIYARVSSVGQLGRDGDEDGYSLPAQVEACKKEAISRGAELAKVYLERAESARSDNRPVLKEMMRELPALGVRYLIVHKVDRFARNRLDDAMLYQRLVGMGITLVSASENIDDTAPGQLMHGMLATFAEYYSNNLSAEVKKGLRQKHEKGGTPFKPPIGYLSSQREAGGQGIRGVELDPVRAPLVKLAFDLYVSGNWSLRDLAEHLAGEGLRSRGSKRFPERVLGANRVHDMLKNPYYIGIVKYDGRSVPGRHQPLIDQDTYDHVQELLAAARVGGDRPQIHEHYLRATVVCEYCHGRLLYGRHRSHTGQYYEYFSCANRTARRRRIRCQNSGHYPVSDVEAEIEQLYTTLQIDRKVKEQIRSELNHEIANRAALIEQDAVRHERTLKRIEAKQEKLVQLYYQDLVTIDVFQREQHKLKAESKAAQRLRRIAAVQGQRVEQALQLALDRLENIHQAYLDATPLERRMMNRAIFKHIEIGEDGDISKSTLTPPYDAISAWQPTLGRPTAAVAAPAPAAPQKAQVRPSSGYADYGEPASLHVSGWYPVAEKDRRGTKL
jgi:site-specific DNA recombinase